MAIDTGLPSTVVKVLETEYGSIQSDIASYLLIPVSTLRRRLKNAERLNVDESDRVVRLARLKDLAPDMMQDDVEATIAWLRTPREILGNESPMEHASADSKRASETSHRPSRRACVKPPQRLLLPLPEGD
jgi:putative toxin-antitoxin system antitoxin component (TIGR02293 family)